MQLGGGWILPCFVASHASEWDGPAAGDEVRDGRTNWSEWESVVGTHSSKNSDDILYMHALLLASGKFRIITQLVLVLALLLAASCCTKDERTGEEKSIWSTCDVPVSLPNLWKKFAMDRRPPFQTYTWRRRWCQPGPAQPAWITITSPTGPASVVL